MRDFRVWHSLEMKHFGSFSSFVVILEIKLQLALLSLYTKVSKNPNPELTSPHTHLTRAILSGPNYLTAFDYQLIRHTNTLSASWPRM